MSHEGVTCQSCGVVVSPIAATEDPETGAPLCVVCAPYDEEREDLAILLIDDICAEMRPDQRPSIGARQPEPPKRASQVIVERNEAPEFIKMNEFLVGLFQKLYADDKPGSANRKVMDHAISLLEDVNTLAKAKLVESPVRQLLMSKEDSEKYLSVLELLHHRYVHAHRRLLDESEDREATRALSYKYLWHLGSMIRGGRLATKPSPWVEGGRTPWE